MLKRKARAAAEVKWRLDCRGDIAVSDCGIYLLYKEEALTDGSKTWTVPSSSRYDMPYEGFSAMQMIAWDNVEVEVVGSSGKLALASPLASLLFAFWCLNVYPEHPQLLSVMNAWSRMGVT